jgi:Tol biopolymer transport system component
MILMARGAVSPRQQPNTRRSRRNLVVGTVALVVAVAGAAATLAHATVPGKNGQVVFGRGAPHRLWLVNQDGTGLRKLTVTKGSRLDDEDPDWSATGAKIAFTRCAQDARCQIWTINPDGTGLTRVGRSAGDDRSEPAWSPDGRTIALSRAWGGVRNDQIKFSEIEVMNANGSGLRQVTSVTTSSPFSADVGQPAWSPDGKRIVFAVHNSPLGDPAKGRALFVIDADGSGQRQLTPWSLNGEDPDWSPDGKLILFRSGSGREQHGNLYTINPDASGLKRLTRYPAPKAVFSGSFSPDGKWITFSRFAPGGPYPAVFVMHPDGTGIRQITKGIYDLGADWGPTP